MLVSIIIPIYKVEPYIVRCIDSVLRQNYRQLEVILVDDCSPDRSMAIAREHILQSPLSKDLKFVYLTHEHNRGLSAARNTGMDAATGEYVFFLDSDDEITEDCIDVLTGPLKKKRYDFVIGDYKTIGANHPTPLLGTEGEIIGSQQIALNYLHRLWYPMAWNKLCSMEYIKNGDMRFQEGLIHEDELWSFQLACTAQSMFAVKQSTYLNYIRSNSITSSTVEHKSIIRAGHYSRVLQGMFQYQAKNDLYSAEAIAIQRQFTRSIYRMLLSGTDEIVDPTKFENTDKVLFIDRWNRRKLFDFCQIFISNKKWSSIKVFIYSLLFG